MMNIIQKAEKYVTNLIEESFRPIFTYHNLEHTKNVVKHSGKIAAEIELSEEDTEILILAAWFHDSGYYEDFRTHEEISAKNARKFLTDNNYDENKIAKIEEAILHTKIPHIPCNEPVCNALCDADLHHFASKNYMKSSEKLREEKGNLYHHEIPAKSYWEQTLKFLQDHRYKTKYGKKVFGKKKELNYQKVVEKVGNYQDKEIKKLTEIVNKLERQNLKLKAPQRGIETMFKVTARNQINLSSIADSKANLMISVNAIIISAIFFIFKNIGEVPHFIIPCIILLIVCLFTITYSVMATRPIVTDGKFTEEDVKKKKVNLLFFGNFHNMDLEVYSKALKGMITDYDELYDSLIKDQYYLGKVLGKKYRFLRTSYTIFMFGLIFSVIAFILAAKFQDQMIW
ncbi:HD domain-containing protein [Marinifilum sp. N1E240]|uniref:Pycsar system effector family protein n=1 Tax=Marinifilum sp. N1E240 TaxID=2608082 RepID=UPI00128AF013|nr:Pycsar system effector family protein [Marinifilum sp. N1E240]MPQ46542.1 HD domain-containing protein [Marinifilum sp. N1E240]